MSEQSWFQNELAEFVAMRTYQRWVEEKGRRETWEEAVDRVVGFLVQVADGALTNQETEDIRRNIISLNVLPSMRAFAMGTQAILKDNTALFNCSYLPVDSIDAFVETLLILQQGTGTGYSVERQYTERLPVVAYQRGLSADLHIVQDSSEGWGAALRDGLEHWYAGLDVEFNCSLVRPAGARLKTKGGRASGPLPLQELLAFTKKTLLNAQGRKLRPIEVSDIQNAIAMSVVVGGVRRSSEISLSDLDDVEMRDAKKGQFWLDTPWRSMSNNSACYRSKPTWEEFKAEFDALAASGTGERGIFSRAASSAMRPAQRKDAEWGVNPCFAPGTVVHTLLSDEVIENLVGKVVTIWDGRRWRDIDNFRVTATNQPILRITMSNGSYERVTPYHTCILSDGTRVQAKDLVVGSYLMPADITGIWLKGYNKVSSVTPDGVEKKVYCCTVPESHSIALASGVLYGQCGEISLRPMEFCNLSSVVARPTDTEETLVEKVRLATIIGTIQAKMTYFPHLRKEWSENCQEERLLGVSLSGHMDSPVVRDAGVQRRLREEAIRVNEQFAARLGIAPAAALSCVKPEGTSSIVAGSSSGMHPQYAKYMIRRVRINATDPLCRLIRDAGVPMHPEVGQEEETATVFVAEFPIKAPDGSLTRHDLTALDQLEYWKQVKLSWTDHNPSQTVYIDADEWDSAAAWCYQNFDIIGGLSFLPKSDAVYLLAPLEEITDAEYLRLVAAFPKIDYSLLRLYEKEDMTEGSRSYSCIGDKCEVL